MSVPSRSTKMAGESGGVDMKGGKVVRPATPRKPFLLSSLLPISSHFFSKSDMPLRTPSFSRRTFLQQLAAGVAVAPFISRYARAQAPSNLVHHATFGANG